MFRIITLVIVSSGSLLTAATAEPIRAAYRADLADEVSRKLSRDADDLLAYYKDLHLHPELSLQEVESARKIATRLEAVGYEVTTKVGGHGVVGLLRNGEGPTVLIRGDMDALPIVEETGLPFKSEVRVKTEDGKDVGVMHACGHDVHQTCLIGTAGMLAHLRQHWSGTVMIVGQPAEEVGAGARMMIEDGLFERLDRADYCLALHVSSSHPAGVVAYTPGWAMANVDSVDITIFGRGGHGSRPHETVDPVLMAAQTIVALQSVVSRRLDPTEPGVITVGSVHAGSKHNIIPKDAKLQITVRSYGDKTRRVLLNGIRDVTVNTCRALGAKRDPQIVVRDHEFTPSTFNDPDLTEAAVGVLREVLGSENVEYRKPLMVGEDFGRYSRHLEVPGFIFWLGSVERDRYEASCRPNAVPLPSLHSSKYEPDPAVTIESGVRAMSSLALSLLKAK